MRLCKHPEEVCCSMTLYHGKVYCDNANGFCHLRDEPPPMTNADHIRSLGDEEMASCMDVFSFCPPDIEEDKLCYKDEDCEKCWLDWLKRPYKEDK